MSVLRNGRSLPASDESRISRRSVDRIADLLAALPPPLQHVLQVTSLSDGQFSATIFAAACDITEIAFVDACEYLCRHTPYIRASTNPAQARGGQIPAYEFQDGIFKQAIARGFGKREKAIAHGRIAEALQRKEVGLAYDRLASFHLAASGRHRDAASAYRRIGRALSQQGAWSKAAAALEQARENLRCLDLPDVAAERLSIVEALTRIYLGMYDDRAVGAAQEAAELARHLREVAAECKALIGLGRALAWSDAAKGAAMLEEAIDRSGQIDAPAVVRRIRCHALAWTNWIMGWSSAHARSAERELREIGELDSDELRRSAALDRSLILFMNARYDDAISAVQNGRPQSDRHRLNPLDPGPTPFLDRMGIPWALLKLGRLADSMRLFEENIAFHAERGDFLNAFSLRAYRTLIPIYTDAPDVARNMIREIERDAAAQGVILKLGDYRMLEVIRGWLDAEAGAFHAARQRLDAVRSEILCRPVSKDWYVILLLEWVRANLELKSGDRNRALSVATEFVAASARSMDRNWRALAHDISSRIHLDLGETLRAAAALRSAWTEKGKYNLPLVKYRLHRTQYDVHASTGNKVAAERHRMAWHAETTRISEGLGADCPIRRSIASGAPGTIALSAASAAARGYGSCANETLTGRERDILALIARGMTNKEIARLCAISPETVKTHSRKIFQKLHVANRSEAAAAFARMT